MKVAVFGLGITGKACASFLVKRGYQVVGIDRKNPQFEDIIFHYDNKPLDFSLFEFCVVSPGVCPSHPLYQDGLKKTAFISEIELALRFFPEQTILGITGTNGKTTLTQMCSHVLNVCGQKAFAVGNVGIPLIEKIEEEGIKVVELSSFQLERTFKPALDLGVCLNITEDHLDRYPDFQSYVNTKAKLFTLTKGPLILDHRVSKIVPPSLAEQVTFFKGDLKEACLKILPHFSLHPKKVEKALATFLPPPHRLEWVKDVQGVSYFNDSKSTNVDSLKYALTKLSPPIFLIAGGLDKGGDFSALKPLVTQKVAHLSLIGDAKEKLAQQMGCVPFELFPSLEQAVVKVQKLAPQGAKVLLSPGCASYDQFKNYEARGHLFKEIVLQLEE